MVRNVTFGDANAIAEIYNHYILNTIVTFEETALSTSEMKSRIADTIPDLPWLVYEENQEILGYAYASKWKQRVGYRFAFEISVYLKNGAGGHGIGTQLYTKLIEILKNNGAKVIIGGVALPNPASLALHDKFGFKKVAHFEQIGIKFGRWIDVVYFELRY